ncbi:MAG: nuclear transport factor 2 family protein [Bacteroidota bacterium]
MKILVCLLVLFTGFSVIAQETSEETAAKNTVEAFFVAFHKQDSLALRELAHPSVTMQSIAEDEEGNVKLTTDTYSDFIKAISSIPEATKFEEKLHSFEIKVNGPLANVITPYSFFVNGELSHCGVNSFQLFKEGGIWKIIYIVDTRSKEDCGSSIQFRIKN